MSLIPLDGEYTMSITGADGETFDMGVVVIGGGGSSSGCSDRQQAFIAATTDCEIGSFEFGMSRELFRNVCGLRGRGTVQFEGRDTCSAIPWEKGQDPVKRVPNKHSKLTNRWGRRK